MHSDTRPALLLSIAAAALAMLSAGSPAAAATPLGPAFQVNTGTVEAAHPQVDGDATAGTFVVVWGEYSGYTGNYVYDIAARRFAADGTPLGDQFQVNQDTRSDLYAHSLSNHVDVGVDATGGFVVAWHGYHEPPLSEFDNMPSIFVRLFDSAGNPLGDEFTSTVPTFEYDEHVNPRLAIDTAGDFVVAWEGVGYYSLPGYPQYQYPNESVFGQVYDASGAVGGAQFQADIYEIYTQGEYGYLDVARAPSGNSFVVVWNGQGPGTGAGYYAYPTYGIHGRRFLFDAPVAKQFSIAVEGDEGYPFDPQIAMDGAGNFVVAWADGDGIAARRFGKGGQPQSGRLQVSEDDDGFGPAIDADAEGNFVVVWLDDDCRGRVLDALGNRRGAEFEIGCDDLRCIDYGCGPDVATLGNEEFVVTWSADGGYVFARRFAMDPLSEVLLPGKSLQIRDHPANVTSLRKATWLARAGNVASPARGSDGDPRCNGDPSGTVKASIRFFSNASGMDTGELDLPCQNWSATGPDNSDPLALQGYKYKDPKLTASLCTNVIVKRSKLVKATCKGIPYDLVNGVDQGVVHAVLTLGPTRYCTSFDDFKGRDGSDGIRFQGKNSPAPEDCPAP